MNDDQVKNMGLLTILFVIVCMSLAFWGWLGVDSEQYSFGRALYAAIKSPLMGDPYDNLPNDSPLQLHIARWLGVLITFWAVIALVRWRFNQGFIRVLAARQRNHVVIIGATPLANALTEKILSTSATSRCVQLCSTSVAERRKKRLFRLPFNGLDSLESAGAGNAEKIVIAMDNDGQAIDLALSVQHKYKDKRHINIMTRVENAWLSQRLHSVPGAEKLRVFSEAAACAREIMRRHPPYLTAQDLKHTRIHLLLVGDYGWLEAIMIEAVLSARTFTYGKLIFSFFAQAVEKFQSGLLKKYPELNEVATVNFYEVERLEAIDKFVDLSPSEPATCAYCAFDDGAHSLSAAIALRDWALRLPQFKAPIFVRMSGAEYLARPVPGDCLKEDALAPFGGMKDIADAIGILSAHADRAERAWHSVYLKMVPKGPAAEPWEDLHEEFRISNRRATGHVAAKLFDAGFDIRPWLARGAFWDRLPSLAPGEKLYRSQEELFRLAELEHERWNADRRMLGWIYGPTRDDERKIHPYLLPFKDLPQKVQEYDIAFIKSLEEKKILVEAPDGLKRPV